MRRENTHNKHTNHALAAKSAANAGLAPRCSARRLCGRYDERRKNEIYIYIIILTCLFSGSANAATVWSGKVKTLNVYPTSTALAFVVEYSHPISTCDDGGRFQLDENAANYNVLASTLLAAFMAGKEIRIGFGDTQTPTCSPIVNRFRVF